MNYEQLSKLFIFTADDDTFVVVENLRFMLKDYDPKNPIYFGCKIKDGGGGNLDVEQGYMSGGAGEVVCSKTY